MIREGRPPRAGALVRSIAAALRPGPRPLATAAALRTVAAAGAIAVLAATSGDVGALSVVYLGAACSVAFLDRGTYRGQAAALLAQGAGAVVGLAAGSLGPHSAAGLIAVAAVAGVVSGAVGGLGPSAPAFGMMLSIGVAFAQFGGSDLSWWTQAICYLVGTAVIAAATLAPWPWRRGVRERRAVAAVFAAAADLAAAIGTPGARTARDRLAAASARARDATHEVHAELVAFATAALFARGHPPPPGVVTAIRTAADQVRRGLPVEVRLEPDRDDPELRALADALATRPSRPGAPRPPARRIGATARSLADRGVALDGARLGLCLGAATALTLALHERDHSFWLALTVAVILRPEYASVVVRTVNRVAGTVVGALLAAAVLAGVPAGPPVAVAAALALGSAVLTAPKLYAFTVVGVTASALLSASIASVDPVLPALRLLDTLLGAVVAVVGGYLLWPGARRPPTTVHLDAARDTARRYLAAAVDPEDREGRRAIRDDAYRLAHRARRTAEAALLEPPPVGPLAGPAVVAAAELEDTVDLITAVASAVDAGGRPAELVALAETRLRSPDPA